MIMGLLCVATFGDEKEMRLEKNVYRKNAFIVDRAIENYQIWARVSLLKESNNSLSNLEPAQLDRIEDEMG